MASYVRRQGPGSAQNITFLFLRFPRRKRLRLPGFEMILSSRELPWIEYRIYVMLPHANCPSRGSCLRFSIPDRALFFLLSIVLFTAPRFWGTIDRPNTLCNCHVVDPAYDGGRKTCIGQLVAGSIVAGH